jgi:ribosome recycling factor
MKKKHFYAHIVDTSSLSLELGGMDMKPHERVHLSSLIDSSIHHAVLDLVLSELNVSDKKVFLTHLASEEHDKVWKLLNSKIENIEDKIRKAANDLKQELHKDVEEAKK